MLYNELVNEINVPKTASADRNTTAAKRRLVMLATIRFCESVFRASLCCNELADHLSSQELVSIFEAFESNFDSCLRITLLFENASHWLSPFSRSSFASINPRSRFVSSWPSVIVAKLSCIGVLECDMYAKINLCWASLITVGCNHCVGLQRFMNWRIELKSSKTEPNQKKMQTSRNIGRIAITLSSNSNANGASKPNSSSNDRNSGMIFTCKNTKTDVNTITLLNNRT